MKASTFASVDSYGWLFGEAGLGSSTSSGSSGSNVSTSTSSVSYGEAGRVYF